MLSLFPKGIAFVRSKIGMGSESYNKISSPTKCAGLYERLSFDLKKLS